MVLWTILYDFPMTDIVDIFVGSANALIVLFAFAFLYHTACGHADLPYHQSKHCLQL